MLDVERNHFLKAFGILGLLALLILLAGCSSGGDGSISVLPSEELFEQSGTADVKIDILFMIDDSGSMSPGQQAMSDNLSEFVRLFNSKGFDFRVAVGKTSAYRNTSPDFFAASHGVKVLESTSTAYNLVDYFSQTVRAVGVSGSGDEKPLQSADNILKNQSAFPRAGAHLAVIYIGDEDDSNQSNNTGSPNSIEWYLASLESLVDAAQTNDSIGSVSTHAIHVTGESDCRAGVGNYGGSTSYGVINGGATAGVTLFAMAALTEGMELSICDNFGLTLSDLADNIAQRASEFYLNDDNIIPETVQVWVNGVAMVNSSNNGFTFVESPSRIVFHGDAIPVQEATIKVTYTSRYLN